MNNSFSRGSKRRQNQPGLVMSIASLEKKRSEEEMQRGDIICADKNPGGYKKAKKNEPIYSVYRWGGQSVGKRIQARMANDSSQSHT